MIALFLIGVALSPLSHLQAQEDNWPCAQILVPVVSAAVIWPYPLDQENLNRWQSNEGAKPLALELVNQFRAGEDEADSIARFLNDKEASVRPDMATDLFLASLNQFNLKRKKYIRGIKKFTGKQKNLASRLTVLLEQRDDLGENDASLTELTDQILLLEQVFRNREDLLADMCEHPVRIEENLGFVARTIATYVE